MTVGLKLAVLLCSTALAGAGCKDERVAQPAAQAGPPSAAAPSPAAAAAPSKEDAVRVLRELAAALDAKDLDKAVGYFYAQPGAPADALRKSVARFPEIHEISADGVEILAARGKWGRLDEVLTGPGKRVPERRQLPPDQCYGLGLEGAQAGFYWTDGQLKIVWCNNIGKLRS
jgi:hypothetical protein